MLAFQPFGFAPYAFPSFGNQQQTLEGEANDVCQSSSDAIALRITTGGGQDSGAALESTVRLNRTLRGNAIDTSMSVSDAYGLFVISATVLDESQSTSTCIAQYSAAGTATDDSMETARASGGLSVNGFGKTEDCISNSTAKGQKFWETDVDPQDGWYSPPVLVDDDDTWIPVNIEPREIWVRIA